MPHPFFNVTNLYAFSMAGPEGNKRVGSIYFKDTEKVGRIRLSHGSGPTVSEPRQGVIWTIEEGHLIESGPNYYHKSRGLPYFYGEAPIEFKGIKGVKEGASSVFVVDQNLIDDLLKAARSSDERLGWGRKIVKGIRKEMNTIKDDISVMLDDTDGFMSKAIKAKQLDKIRLYFNKRQYDDMETEIGTIFSKASKKMKGYFLIGILNEKLQQLKISRLKYENEKKEFYKKMVRSENVKIGSIIEGYQPKQLGQDSEYKRQSYLATVNRGIKSGLDFNRLHFQFYAIFNPALLNEEAKDVRKFFDQSDTIRSLD